MARPRSDVLIQRFNVRLPEPDAAWVTARAAAGGKSAPSVIAAAVSVVREQSCSDSNQDVEDALVLLSPRFQAVMREKEELAARVTELRRRLAEQRIAASNEAEKKPRWAWPLDKLMDDSRWWDRWLPRLYEVIGRDGAFGAERRPTDERGYVDLMKLLFPPAAGISWRSIEYPAAARSESEEAEKRSQRATISQPWAARAQVWEPTVRHVALALAALEATGQPGADAYQTIQVGAKIIGVWHETLRVLLGLTRVELPAAGRG